MERITMTPDPLYMTLKNMRQSEHADRPYAGNLAGHEYVVSKLDYPSISIEDEASEELTALRARAMTDAQAFVNASKDYRSDDEATLIEIRVVGHIRPKRTLDTFETPALTTGS